MEDRTIFKNDTTHVFIKKLESETKTDVYAVVSKKGIEADDWIAKIKWNGGWRKYRLETDVYTAWDENCLENIIAFLREINIFHKQKDGAVKLAKKILDTIKEV